MDPTAVLLELRQIVGLVRGHKRMTTTQVVRMVDLVDGLDQHLAKGGVLPQPWHWGLSAAEHGAE